MSNRLAHKKSDTPLQTGIREYIRYYNHERIRTKLKGLSPVHYRNQALAA
jgi:putative transposase